MTEAETILHKLAAVLKRVDRADGHEVAPVDNQDPAKDPEPPEAGDPPSASS